ncbi:MAG: glycerate kinase [Chloroflexota bacterium]|nr:glycerate kinase [Chloroflexota bacterium]
MTTPLRILVCPQEFKGSLTAMEAAAALAAGARSAEPDAEIVEMPLADGGPGTAAILAAARGGELVATEVTGPLGSPVQARFALLPPSAEGGAPAAVVEAAEAAGLVLVPHEERNPARATTYGVGQLMRAAIERGARDITVAVGGTGTNDGGAGAAQALGYQLVARGGVTLPEPAPPLDLRDLVSLDHSGVDRRLGEVDLTVAVDVTNVLLGLEGATVIYGPQKGVDSDTMQPLEDALGRWSRVIEDELGVRVTDLAGGGAGGGLAAGLVGTVGGAIQSGAELVATAVGLEDAIRDADLVMTGEGRLDAQTTYGKALELVTALAERYETPCVVVAGGVEGATSGVVDFETLTTNRIFEAEAMRRAAELAEAAAERLVRRGTWDTAAIAAEEAARRDLIEAGTDLRADGLVTSHGGNVSVRRPRGGAVISATGAMLGRLTDDLLVAVEAEGELRDADAAAPSSDTAVHLAIYEACADAGAVVHAHPVHAIALAYGRDAIDPANLEGRLFLGSVPVLEAEWETSAQPVAEALREHPIVVVRGHGSYARGTDVWDALRVTSTLEEAARILALSGQ